MTFINNTFDTVDDEELAVALALKSDKLTTYTKSQVDSSFQPTGDYASTTALNTKQGKPPENETFAYQSAVDAKANTADVDTSLGLKANTTDVNTAMATKANTTDVTLKANQTDVDTAMSLKANQTDVDTAMATKANTTDVALKANQTDVDTAMTLKANQTDVDTAMALKADQADLENLATQANLTDVNTTVASHTTSLTSHDGLIQGLYDANYASISLLNARNYATEGWVNSKDYATESYVDGAVVTTGAISLLLDVALQGTATTAQITQANQATSDVLDNLTTNYVPRPADYNILSSPDGLKSYVEEKVLAGENIVRKPEDWSTYPSGNFGGLPPTLRSYTDGKLNEVQEGIQSYMKLRDYTVSASGNRTGETRIEFLRTNPTEAFGSNECVDWKIGANSLCGFDIYRKGTHPTLGVLYNGTVLEFDQDGDVNCVKAGGLKVNGNEVATKTYTDTTFAAISVEQSVSDLSTTSSSHGMRITDIEDAGYATTSQLSAYALSSSLGTTNTTVGGINTRVNTLETSGFVTSAGLGGYNFATQGYVQDNLPDVSNFVTSSTLTTNHYTKSETDTAIPDVSNFVTSSTLTTNHYTKTQTDSAIPDVSNFVTSSTLTTNHYTKDETDTAISNAGGSAGGDGANISGTVGDSSGGVSAVYFLNTENAYTPPYYTDKSGILAFDENFIDNEYGTGTYDPEATFVGGDGGGLLIKNQDGWGAIFTSQNTRWAKGYWNSLDVNGSTRSGYNTNTTSYFGRSAIGYCGHNDICSLAHIDRNNMTDYALLQSSGGTTYLNCKSDSSIRFRSGNSDKMRMLANGNFGVGTTSPAQKLDVAGRIRCDTMEMDSYIYHVGDTNTYFGFDAADHFRIVEGGGTRLQVDSNGRIGIGTTGPAQLLDVAGRIRADTMEMDSYIYHVGDTNTYFGFDAADHFSVNIAGGRAISVDSNKWVGIGRNPPTKRLDVAGPLRCDELFYGDFYDYYEKSSLTCTKTRRSSGDPSITFTINAVNQVGWIPFTYTVTGSSVYSNGGSHFHRYGYGHGRYYNGSRHINEIPGVLMTATQSGNRANLTWKMDDYGRNYTILEVTLSCYEGIID